jgi:hypothetical protein
VKVPISEMSWDRFDLAAQLQKVNKKKKIAAKPTVYVAATCKFLFQINLFADCKM